MKRYGNEQSCYNEKACGAMNSPCRDASYFIRHGQHLHDDAVYMALSHLIGFARKVLALGAHKGYPPVLPKKGSRRGWAA